MIAKNVEISSMPCRFNTNESFPSKLSFFLRLIRNATRIAPTRKNEIYKKPGGSANVLLLHNILSAVTKTALTTGET